MRPRTLARLALLATLTGACSGIAPPSPPPNAPGDLQRILVTLHPAPLPAWQRDVVALAASHGLFVYRAWLMGSLDRPCVVYSLPTGESMGRMIARLTADHRVESAQPVQRFEVLAGADPYAHLQHGAAALGAEAAHRWATGRGVQVAVVDTGVDVGHPDLSGRVVRVGDFVEHGRRTFTRDVHGTAVVGVLAAAARNGIGIAGIAPEADILALKACWPKAEGASEAVCDSYSLAQALDVAVIARAQVVNLSLSGPDDPLLARILAAAVERGSAVVAAVDPGRPALGFPASLPGVIAVAAEGTPFAAAGGRTVLTAPGDDILAPVPGGGYDFFSGSSMASAQVAGVVALLLERRPDLSPSQVAEILAASARPAEPAGTLRPVSLPVAANPTGQDAAPPAPTVGPFRVDACRALTRLMGVSDGCGEDTVTAH